MMRKIIKCRIDKFFKETRLFNSPLVLLSKGYLVSLSFFLFLPFFCSSLSLSLSISLSLSVCLFSLPLQLSLSSLCIVSHFLYFHLSITISLSTIYLSISVFLSLYPSLSLSLSFSSTISLSLSLSVYFLEWVGRGDARDLHTENSFGQYQTGARSSAISTRCVSTLTLVLSSIKFISIHIIFDTVYYSLAFYPTCIFFLYSSSLYLFSFLISFLFSFVTFSS